MTEWMSVSKEGIRKSAGFDKAMEAARTKVEPAPSWAELEAWRNAPSDTASSLVVDGVGAGVREVTLEEAEVEVEADERDTFRFLFGCCGDPGDCGECGGA